MPTASIAVRTLPWPSLRTTIAPSRALSITSCVSAYPHSPCRASFTKAFADRASILAGMATPSTLCSTEYTAQRSETSADETRNNGASFQVHHYMINLHTELQSAKVRTIREIVWKFNLNVYLKSLYCKFHKVNYLIRTMLYTYC